MSRKRTRSSKTTPENPIVINEEVKERFDSIFKHQSMMLKKGFNLKSNDLMVFPVPIRKTINSLKWERFCDARSLPNDELVREFYASLTTQDVTEVIIWKKKVPLTSKSINDLFNLPDVKEDEYYPMMNNINWDFLQQVLDVVTNPGSLWIIRKNCLFPIINHFAFLRARVKTQVNLKGQYVTGCITSHDLERLVEKVHELNQGEQEEPTEPDTEESTNETEAELVTDTKEEESYKEPNSSKPVEGSKNPKPRVEPEEEPVKLSVEPEYTTPMPTSASTSLKSELSILMDMSKFMHNQQQTYWKYAKIKDDSI
ncbi:hypothetical protein PVK06_024095 [Gossypium arboreum]|uniref:Uncharacterized protein n=1 Tax=Gossypium arboreum TaxID=29729 RepID=A0ABR0PD39_GOSAR|nr:hypothetical protein PVK06_024095 [Gossypium arboreum]